MNWQPFCWVSQYPQEFPRTPDWWSELLLRVFHSNLTVKVSRLKLKVSFLGTNLVSVSRWGNTWFKKQKNNFIGLQWSTRYEPVWPAAEEVGCICNCALHVLLLTVDITHITVLCRLRLSHWLTFTWIRIIIIKLLLFYYYCVQTYFCVILKSSFISLKRRSSGLNHLSFVGVNKAS